MTGIHTAPRKDLLYLVNFSALMLNITDFENMTFADIEIKAHQWF